MVWLGFGYTADTDMKDDYQVRILDTPILNAWQTFGAEEVRPMDVGSDWIGAIKLSLEGS